LYLLRWIKNNASHKFIILIEKGGEIEELYHELGPTFVVRPRRPTLFQKIWIKIGYISYMKSRLKKLYDEPVGLIYLNTFSNGRLVSILKRRFKCRLITHVHELESVIRESGSNNIQLLTRMTDHFIAASRSVRDNLILNHAVSGNRITVHYEAIESFDQNRKNKNGEPDATDFVVGGAGFVDYRKGFDLFLETARILAGEKTCGGIRFVWVGGFGRHKQKITEKYIKQYGLEEYVTFTGEMADPFPVYQRSSLFFLSSREDPFPLVMLEHAYLGIPVIGFRGSGGVEEFLDYDPELLADPADIRGVAQLILNFRNNSRLAERAGEKLRKKVTDQHLIDKVGKSYFNRILQMGGMEPGKGDETGQDIF
jgi:glycosyltransferase involved in cell wall biosynthesis